MSVPVDRKSLMGAECSLRSRVLAGVGGGLAAGLAAAGPTLAPFGSSARCA